MSKIFMVHFGISDYVRVCYKNAKNFGNKIIFIGDDSANNPIDLKNIEGNKNKRFDEFKRYYVHMSSNPKNIELLCFERYFWIEAYVNKYQIKNFWMIDSDVFLLGNLNEYSSKYLVNKNISAGLSIPMQNFKDLDWAASPHTSWWTKDGITSFINHSIKTYKENIDVLKEKADWNFKKSNTGGISDMALLYLWAQSNRILNLAKNHEVTKILIDHNITMRINYDKPLDGYLGYKRIKYEKNKWIIIDENGHKIEILSLHFQGEAKKLIKYFYMIKHRIIFNLIYIYKLIRIIKNILR